MNKVASVVYAYSPKNDDELELAVGDKIEVIGYEEEGWWKGKLKGRVGVFPSNFVEVVESVSSSSQQQQQQQQVSNKLNSIFGSKVSSKNSISSNSLNTLNNNCGTNSLNNNTSSSNNNLIMNNTHNDIDSTNNEYPFAPAEESLNSSASSNEKRPRPIRGNGFGDIFAAGAKPILRPLPADPSKPAMASERLSTIANNLTSTLQKPIPKKPPPPAPANNSTSNGSLPDQAPALPPKPSNQLSPFMQQQQQQQTSSRSLPPATHSPASVAQVREQVRVIYAYKSSIPDELTIEVGDIINVIDKNIEDVGWWKGELNGKIGVFPDNFVKPITTPDIPTTSSTPSQQQDWNSSGSRASSASQHHGAAIGITQQPTAAIPAATTTDNKIKSVFAATPKGFSKELENNLEKHGNPALFLSLKRNKLQQQQQANPTSEDTDVAQTKSSEMVGNKRDSDGASSQESSPTKLNHITANRAKGPSRRPPSSILNKRSQPTNDTKRETNGRLDETAPCSLPHNSGTSQQQPTNHDAALSLPFGANRGPPISNATAPGLPAHDAALAAPKSKSIPDAEAQQQQQVVSPKLPIGGGSSRFNQTAPNQAPESKGMTPSTATSATPSPSVGRPPWMVELRKSNLEKKRDTSALNQDDDSTAMVATVVNSKAIDPLTALTINNAAGQNELMKTASPERKNSIQSLKESYNPPISTVKSISSRYTTGDLGAPVSQQSINSDVSARTSLLGPLPTQVEPSSVHQQQDVSPVTNRLNSLFGRSQSPQSKSVVAPFSSTENGSHTTHNVPSNENKYLGTSPNSTQTTTSTNQINNLDTGILGRTVTSASKVVGTTAVERQAAVDNETKFVMSKAQYDNLLKQISNSVNTEISELKSEMKKLKEEVKGVHELKAVIESMKLELTACQSATENQKRYIRELVTNLADERKKIAAMQGELEKNFK